MQIDGPVCPACGFRIFNRRWPKCEGCGIALSAPLVWTEAQINAAQEAEQRTRAAQAQKRAAEHQRPIDLSWVVEANDYGGGDIGGE